MQKYKKPSFDIKTCYFPLLNSHKCSLGRVFANKECLRWKNSFDKTIYFSWNKDAFTFLRFIFLQCKEKGVHTAIQWVKLHSHSHFPFFIIIIYVWVAVPRCGKIASHWDQWSTWISPTVVGRYHFWASLPTHDTFFLPEPGRVKDANTAVQAWSPWPSQEKSDITEHPAHFSPLKKMSEYVNFTFSFVLFLDSQKYIYIYYFHIRDERKEQNGVFEIYCEPGCWHFRQDQIENSKIMKHFYNLKCKVGETVVSPHGR